LCGGFSRRSRDSPLPAASKRWALPLRAFAADKDARIRQDSKEAATAWRNLGAIAGLRDPKSAREAYARAVMLDPDDTESLYWHGQLEFEAGDLAAAELSYRRLLTLKQAEPDSHEVYWARLGRGDIERARGRLDSALAGYRTVQASAERLATSDPGNAGWQRDLSVSFDRIGNVQVEQGDLAGALKPRHCGAPGDIRRSCGRAEVLGDIPCGANSAGSLLSAVSNSLKTGKLTGILEDFRHPERCRLQITEQLQ
jgi:tetratricopeptide (TPR) repeat protein